jgi:hypothetical protein
VSQQTDFATGELVSRSRFQAGDTTAEIDVVTFCSRTDPALVLQEVVVRPDRDAEVVLTAAIDSDVPGRWLDGGAIPRGQPPTAHAWLAWESSGGLSTCGLVLAAESDDPDVERIVEVDRATCRLAVSFRRQATAHQPIRIRSIVGLVPDLAHSRPHRQAALLVARAMTRGWEAMREANRAAWADLWRGRPLIDARGDWQHLADASFYYLHASASVASISSTGVFGLASAPDYHYYRGHVMWDIETFAFPSLVLTAPDAARAILGFRGRTMPAARMNAALHGDPGLLYPWEADSARGDEAVPRWSKTDKDHVSLDVGLAFELFANVTGDRLFARLEALPVVAGVAEWLLSRVEATDRGLEIRHVRGPAEAFEAVDNNAWVNLAAITFLRQAAALVRTLGDDPPDAWEAAAEAIVIPRDGRTGAIVNHDGFRLDEPLGETPEAAAAFFPLGFRDGAATERATLRYALRHQVDRYVGTPMFSALLGTHAAWLGRRKQAADLFERGYAAFFDDPFMAPDEFPAADGRFPQASPMMANLGGFLGSLFYGLPGLRPTAGHPRTWASRRVILPAGWTSIEAERVWVRGRPTRLIAVHGADHAVLEVGERRWIDDRAGAREPVQRLRPTPASGGLPTEPAPGRRTASR